MEKDKKLKLLCNLTFIRENEKGSIVMNSADLDSNGITLGVVVISKDDQASVGADQEERSDAQHVQPDGSGVRFINSGKVQ